MTISTPLPDTVLIHLDLASNSYFDINISNGGFISGFYDAWCVDFDTLINLNQTYTANVYSSYEPIPSGLIERPENLDLVNWILNQNFFGTSSPEGNTYDQMEIQQAIWHLVESDRPTTDQDALTIVNLALANGEGYIPQSGGNIGIILDPIDGNGNNIGQVIITPIPMPRIPDQPNIDVEKYVSVDGGKTWYDADIITGPYATENTFDPIFKFVVQNTGNVDLRNISLTDSDYDLNGSAPGTSINIDFLASGGTYESYFTAPWQSGQHTDTASVNTNYTDITNRTYNIGDQDDANYFGASPDIDLEKYVSVDGGNTWFDADDPAGPEVLAGIAPEFKFVITNTGNVNLENVTLDDNIFNLDGLAGDLVTGDNGYTLGFLEAGNSVEILYNGTWQEGQHTNTGTTSGTYTDSNGYTSTPTDNDNANYFGASPDIDLEKYVSVDGGNTWFDADDPAGPMLTEGQGDPMFKFTLTNTGNVALSNVTLNDNIFNLDGLAGDLVTGDNSYTLGSLAVGNTVDIFYNGTWEAGQHTNIGTTTSSYTDTNGKTTNPTDRDNANYYGDALPEISVIKTATPDQIYEHKGGLVTYQITITNESDPNCADLDPVTITSLPDTLWVDYNGDKLQQASELNTIDRITDALQDWYAQGNTGDIILDPGESFTFDYTTIYEGNNTYTPWEDPSNTIVGIGHDDEGNQAIDQDTAVVDILQKNQRSIEMDKLTGIKQCDTITGNFKITNASGDPVDVLINSLDLDYQIKGKGWTDMDESLYTTKFWVDSNPNGILDSEEVLLVDLDLSTLDIFETAIRFGSSVTVGYETTFNDIVPNPIKATAQSTIDGRIDKQTGDLREFQYSATF